MLFPVPMIRKTTNIMAGPMSTERRCHSYLRAFSKKTVNLKRLRDSDRFRAGKPAAVSMKEIGVSFDADYCTINHLHRVMSGSVGLTGSGPGPGPPRPTGVINEWSLSENGRDSGRSHGYSGKLVCLLLNLTWTAAQAGPGRALLRLATQSGPWL